jgi:hypothetical protein
LSILYYLFIYLFILLVLQDNGFNNWYSLVNIVIKIVNFQQILGILNEVLYPSMMDTLSQ